MVNLKYKTRGNSSPQGKPRVYFCCHPEDFETYFESLSDEILTKQNCAVWYTDQAVKRDEDFLVDLKQMQLFVMPVTTNLLCSENDVLNIEFTFAIENHIPVLPLMQESGLEELFNQKCGDLQFLDKHTTDSTAIGYDEKLDKYLSSVLIGDELAEKIRAAFDAYVFLSYRKKDRRYAQELMRLIHKNEFCRNIAIWYDEFLTPGENFNDSIKDALQKSGLFVLAVTPNLVNETNYIMTTEYPMAKQEGKLILPAELVPTDREQLSKKYEDIPNPTDAHNEVELSEALLESIKKMALKDNDDSPEHNFFIGLAYLGGVDVEFAPERALRLITSASESGVAEATKELVSIYQNGVGVARDYYKSLDYQIKLIEQYEVVYAKTNSEDDLISLLDALTECGRACMSLGLLDDAKKKFDAVKVKTQDALVTSDSSLLKYSLYASYSSLGDVISEMGMLESAIDHYYEGLDVLLMLVLESDLMGLKDALCMTYRKIGHVHAKLHQHDDALEMYNDARKTAYELADEEAIVEAETLTADIYIEQGRICEALDLYEKSRHRLQQLYTETHSERHIYNLAIVHSSMGKALEINRQFDMALQQHAEACKIKEGIVERTNTMQSRISLSTTYDDMAITYVSMNRQDEAFELMQKALRVREKLANQIDLITVKQDLAASYNNLASILVPMGQIDVAISMYQRVIAIREELVQRTENIKLKLDLCSAYDNLGTLYRLLKKPEQALELFQKSIDIIRNMSSEKEDAAVVYQRAFSHLNLGMLNEDPQCLETAYLSFDALARKHPEVSEYATKRDFVLKKLKELPAKVMESSSKPSYFARFKNLFKK